MACCGYEGQKMARKNSEMMADSSTSASFEGAKIVLSKLCENPAEASMENEWQAYKKGKNGKKNTKHTPLNK